MLDEGNWCCRCAFGTWELGQGMEIDVSKRDKDSPYTEKGKRLCIVRLQSVHTNDVLTRTVAYPATQRIEAIVPKVDSGDEAIQNR